MSEFIEELLKRHINLVNLGKFLKGDRKDFIKFLENVYLFEKGLEENKDTSELQCNIMSDIIKDYETLKKVHISKEWQLVQDYLKHKNNIQELLNTIYRLEINKSDEECKCLEKRKELIREAFFESPEKGEVIYKETNVKLKFIFSESPRWNLEGIEWKIVKIKGENWVIGKLIISLGSSLIDNIEYKSFYAYTGDEKKALALLGIESITDLNLRITVEELLEKLNIKPSDIEKYCEEEDLKEKFKKWIKLDKVEREFSEEGVSFILELLEYLKEKNNKQGYEFLKTRLEDFGFKISYLEKPIGYEFSDEIEEDVPFHRKPKVEYFSPIKNKWEILFPGEFYYSAGKLPKFLREIYKLEKQGILKPRKPDLEAVKNLLLYIHLGDKVSKPPILPVYNALRRWFETLSSQKEYTSLKILCEYSKIFRPYIYVPYIGENPLTEELSFPSKNKYKKSHILIPQIMSDYKYKPGTIIEIYQPGIVVPNDKMFLFLTGKYKIATTNTTLQELIISLTNIVLEEKPEKLKNMFLEEKPEKLRNILLDLIISEEIDKFILLLKRILKNIQNLPEQLWEKIKKSIDYMNKKTGKEIIFLDKRKIDYEEFKTLQNDTKYKIKLVHTMEWEQGSIISQEPSLEKNTIIISSGIPYKMLSYLKDIYDFAQMRGYSDNKKWLNEIYYNLLSFLSQEEQIKEIERLLDFCSNIKNLPENIEKYKKIIDNWIEKKIKKKKT